MEAVVAIIVLSIVALPLMVIAALVGVSNLKGRVRTLEAQLARVQVQLREATLASAPGRGVSDHAATGEGARVPATTQPAGIPVAPPTSSVTTASPLVTSATAPTSAVSNTPSTATAPMTQSAPAASPVPSTVSGEVSASVPSTPSSEALTKDAGTSPATQSGWGPPPSRTLAEVWGVSEDFADETPAVPAPAGAADARPARTDAPDPGPTPAGPVTTRPGTLTEPSPAPVDAVVQATLVSPPGVGGRANVRPPPEAMARETAGNAPGGRAPGMAGTPRSPATPAVGGDEMPGFDPGAVIRGWFTEGNVPVKVGVLVLLIGVAALLKYASDQGWLSITIGMRLAGITAAALGALVFAWRKRHSHRVFALTMQGGAIGVLLLVVFAAFKLYGMVPAAAAFGLSVLLVAALGVLSVIQDARVLAVLGIFAGFLAPIWLSTGAGNHVVLFSYYALLNAGIFGIAWMRSWRELNLMGWAFTWGIGTLWGADAYDPSRYGTTQPFLVLFFVLYLLLPILSVRRETPGRRGFVNGALVFGTPLVAFSLQAALLEGKERPLALCALVLAVVYAGLWWWLRGRDHKLLAGAYGLLAASFATLAVPLALSARATSAVFALEGAGLIWLGLRQRRGASQLAGTGLQLLAALSFLFAAIEMEASEHIFANGRFAGALLLAVAGFACAWWYRSEKRNAEALLFYGWGLAWWGGGLLLEVGAHVEDVYRPDALLVLLALTAWVVAEVHRKRPASALPFTVLGLFVMAALMVIDQWAVRDQPLTPSGFAAWLLFAGFGVRTLVALRHGGGASVPAVHFSWCLLWPFLASVSSFQMAEAWTLGLGWQTALVALPWLLLMALVLEAWRWVRWPSGAAVDGSRSGLLGTCIALIGFGWWLALLDSGESHPLPWLPVLNPLELTLLGALGLFARWLWTPTAPKEVVTSRSTLLSLAIFVLVTNLTLRSVHHLGGVPWGEDLWRSSLAQMSLTMVWSVLGVVAWIAGSKGGKRSLWMAGAVLMAVVLAKLVLVDRQHLGDLLGIGSFFAYGLMCTLVGWFAPAPPREGADRESGKAA